MKKSSQRAVRLFLAALFRLGGHIRISPVESGKAGVSLKRRLGPRLRGDDKVNLWKFVAIFGMWG